MKARSYHLYQIMIINTTRIKSKSRNIIKSGMCTGFKTAKIVIETIFTREPMSTKPMKELVFLLFWIILYLQDINPKVAPIVKPITKERVTAARNKGSVICKINANKRGITANP